MPLSMNSWIYFVLSFWPWSLIPVSYSCDKCNHCLFSFLTWSESGFVHLIEQWEFNLFLFPFFREDMKDAKWEHPVLTWFFTSGKEPFYNWCCFTILHFNLFRSCHKKWVWICQSWKKSKEERLCSAADNTWRSKHWASLWYNSKDLWELHHSLWARLL
jgi:hypothetical protein